MCGRYYVDDETAREIEKVIRQVDEKLRCEASGGISFPAKDVHPTDMALVLASECGKLSCITKRWGFPGFEGKQVIFNARSESVLEKRTFRDSTLHRRTVVPATGCRLFWRKRTFFHGFSMIRR